VYLPPSQKELINLDVQITGLYSSAPVDFAVSLHFPNETEVGAPQTNVLTANSFGAAYGSHGTGGQGQGLAIGRDGTGGTYYDYDTADATIETDCDLPVDEGYFRKPTCSLHLLLDVPVHTVSKSHSFLWAPRQQPPASAAHAVNVALSAKDACGADWDSSALRVEKVSSTFAIAPADPNVTAVTAVFAEADDPEAPTAEGLQMAYCFSSHYNEQQGTFHPSPGELLPLPGLVNAA
jgi:hypothetical protein